MRTSSENSDYRVLYGGITLPSYLTRPCTKTCEHKLYPNFQIFHVFDQFVKRKENRSIACLIMLFKRKSMRFSFISHALYITAGIDDRLYWSIPRFLSASHNAAE